MTTGTVKFFNAAKGFGFIAPDDGEPDVFVHISAVERSGLQGLNEGDQVGFELQRDRKTGKVAAADLQLLSAGAAPARRPSPGGFAPRGRSESRFDGPRDSHRSGGAVEGSGEGVVKWFNQTKGFGFIKPSDGGGDIFVHISAVEQAGLRGLDEGQPVAYDLERDSRSGKTSAVNLRLG